MGQQLVDKDLEELDKLEKTQSGTWGIVDEGLKKLARMDTRHLLGGRKSRRTNAAMSQVSAAESA